MSGDGASVDVSAHWSATWSSKDETETSWFQAECTRSLALVEEVSDPTAAVVDVGGGSSHLVDGLLDAGYIDLAVVDVAAAAFDQARARLGARADQVRWIVADIRRHRMEPPVDVWHDRAAFHFLVDPADRDAYVDRLAAGLRPGGHAVIATFSATGPEQCSGLPVQRYDEQALAAAFDGVLEPMRFEPEVHRTPWDSTQDFLYGLFRRPTGPT